jgi:hypothetical protein
MGSRKTRLIVAGILAAALLVGGSTVAYANGGGATIIKDASCCLSAADSGLAIDLFSTDVICVETPSGNVVLTCHFDIPEGYEPAKAIKNTGFLCGTCGGCTTDSQCVVTPGGKAVLRCEIKAPKD